MAGDLVEAGASVETADREGVTPLMAAAFEGDTRRAGLLIERGANIEARDAHGKGALIYAAGRAYPEMVALLLEAGAEPDGRWGADLTPLMWAAARTTPPRRMVSTLRRCSTRAPGSTTGTKPRNDPAHDRLGPRPCGDGSVTSQRGADGTG